MDKCMAETKVRAGYEIGTPVRKADTITNEQ